MIRRMTPQIAAPVSKVPARIRKIPLANLREGGRRWDMKRGFWALLAGLGAVFGLAGLMMAEPLEIGKAVPEVEGKNHKGEVVKLHEAAGRGWALIFFFPKAGTGG